MNPLKRIKMALLGGFFIVALLLTVSSVFPEATEADDQKAPSATSAKGAPEDYVGSETCQACHEDQFNSFSKTAHAGLKHAGWKAEKQGCESCHGPGKAHVEAGGDKLKIRTFEGESPKQKSEACLECHAGREEHNNFRRGEHWRNDVGCTDCHSPHFSARTAEKAAAPSQESKNVPSSLQPFGPFSANSNDVAPPRMLLKNEPQLCMSCHNETKAQFTRPFHHKVLEGAMKCSDCHNPHGGFEQKQARLATGSDAACVKCHTDKQGPFAYEHAPVKTEGCASCHTPHGSANPRLLRTSSVAQLCLECHTQDHGVGALEPVGPAHPLYLQYRDCTACHVKIHGSHTSPVFMR